MLPAMEDTQLFSVAGMGMAVRKKNSPTRMAIMKGAVSSRLSRAPTLDMITCSTLISSKGDEVRIERYRIP